MSIEEENARSKHRYIHNFQGINLDTPIYRVFPIDRLLQLFNGRKNTLVKPALWDDPFENSIFQQQADYKDLATGITSKVGMSNISDRFYGQCWTLNQNETDALWRIYSPNKDGVRVKTTLNKLWDSFFNVSDPAALMAYQMGRIEYWTEKEFRDYFEVPENLYKVALGGGTSALMPLYLKRKEFEHEDEIRIIYVADPDKGFDLTQNIYQYSLDPFALFDELLFDPRFDPGIYSIMKEEFIRRGFINTIEKSKLYDFPKFDLKLN